MSTAARPALAPATSADTPYTPNQARELRDGQHARLAVSEQHPRKPAEQVRATQLGGDPDERGRQQRSGSEPCDRVADDKREQRGEEREVRDEQGIDEHSHPRLQAAIHHHDARDPIERAREVHDAGRQAERECPPERATAERQQQRRERDPAEGRSDRSAES